MAIQKITSGIIQDGAIVAADIVSIANTQITGNIVSSQITSVANTQITGNIVSSQITSVANTQITGNITAAQITSVANTQITGNIISSQITSVANTQITGNVTATNLSGGSNGTIPYQSAAGTTQMLAVGTSGQVLQTNGAGAPTWVTPSGGAMVFISQTTLSGSSTTISIDNSTYSSYLFLGSNIATTAAVSTIDFYIRANGISTAKYSSGGYGTGNGTPQGYNSGTNTADTYMTPHKPGYNYTGTYLGDVYAAQMMLQVFDTRSLGQQQHSGTAFISTWQSSGNNSRSFGAAQFANGGLTSITFSWSNGATMTGIMRVYGIV